MPRFRDLLNYCRRTGWIEKRTNDHYHFAKVLPDGTILRTRVFHSLSREIPPDMFARILRQELRTTKEEFNRNG